MASHRGMDAALARKSMTRPTPNHVSHWQNISYLVSNILSKPRMARLPSLHSGTDSGWITYGT